MAVVMWKAILRVSRNMLNCAGFNPLLNGIHQGIVERLSFEPVKWRSMSKDLMQIAVTLSF